MSRTVEVDTSFLRPKATNGSPIRLNQQTVGEWKPVKDAISPETVLRTPIWHKDQGAELGVVNVLSPYTKGLHVMLLDMTDRYRPTPGELPDFVGKAAVQTAADIVGFAENMEGFTDAISVGYNNTPTNYGEAEEKNGGMQSMTTKWHLHVWNRGVHDEAMPFEELSEDKRKFLVGDPLVKLGGELVSHFVKAETYQRFVSPDSHQVDKTGFRPRLTTDLKTALQNPEFFTGFLKPLHLQLEAASADISGALTDFDYQGFKETVGKGFEGKQTVAHKDLQVVPAMHPDEARSAQIGELLAKGYPPSFVRRLDAYNRFFKDPSAVADTERMRKGLGYALVMTQKHGEDCAELIIRPAVLISTSRGGVVEAQGYVTKRVIGEGTPEAELVRNRETLRELTDHLIKQRVLRQASLQRA